MYEEHPVLEQPADLHEKVWRYMDFAKFVSLLESSSLYFTRADKFDDPFEGSYPKANVEARSEFPPIREALGSIFRERRENVFINCWHLNIHESAAMWKLYLKSNEGIAIQTTYSKLRKSFIRTEYKIFIGKVNYIDYENEAMKPYKKGVQNLFMPYVHKRMSFAHEREVRAMIDLSLEQPHVASQTVEPGLLIPVELDALIEKVYVSPESPKWIPELIESVIKRYEKDYEVVHSDLLSKSPLF